MDERLLSPILGRILRKFESVQTEEFRSDQEPSGLRIRSTSDNSLNSNTKLKTDYGSMGQDADGRSKCDNNNPPKIESLDFAESKFTCPDGVGISVMDGDNSESTGSTPIKLGSQAKDTDSIIDNVRI